MILFLDVDGVLNTRATKPGADGVRDIELRPVNNPQVRFTGVLGRGEFAGRDWF